VPTHDRRPAVRAPEAAWRRLGELLQLRRAELGYRRRPAFTREHQINIRLVTDIENAYRPNTFLTPTLRDIAQAYQVTYDSLIAVLAGTADGLVPAAPAGPAAGLPGAPMDDAARESAVRPYAAPIWERLLGLAADGITDPARPVPRRRQGVGRQRRAGHEPERPGVARRGPAAPRRPPGRQLRGRLTGLMSR
jgi:hypothetical protein